MSGGRFRGLRGLCGGFFECIFARSPRNYLIMLSRVARIPDLVWGPFWEAVLILIAGLTALWSGHPWLFASLGPTAYEMAEKPELRSARAYNIIVGHLVGMACGFAAVALTKSWFVPSVSAHTFLTPARVCAAILAVFATVLFNLLLKSGQPAALATTLLIALGNMQTAASTLWIMIGVLMITVVGEPVRRVRLNALHAAGKLPRDLTCQVQRRTKEKGGETHESPLAA